MCGKYKTDDGEADVSDIELSHDFETSASYEVEPTIQDVDEAVFVTEVALEEELSARGWKEVEVTLSGYGTAVVDVDGEDCPFSVKWFDAEMMDTSFEWNNRVPIPVRAMEGVVGTSLVDGALANWVVRMADVLERRYVRASEENWMAEQFGAPVDISTAE